MSDLLRGSFEVKNKVEVKGNANAESDLKSEFRKKAMASIGGSMVFVEREKLFWDGDDE